MKSIEILHCDSASLGSVLMCIAVQSVQRKTISLLVVQQVVRIHLELVQICLKAHPKPDLQQPEIEMQLKAR